MQLQISFQAKLDSNVEAILVTHLFGNGVHKDALIQHGANQVVDSDPHESHHEIAQEVNHSRISLSTERDVHVPIWNRYRDKDDRFQNDGLKQLEFLLVIGLCILAAHVLVVLMEQVVGVFAFEIVLTMVVIEFEPPQFQAIPH